MPQMIIANRLTDGLVVFYVSDGVWSKAIADGLVIDDDEAEVLAAAVEAARRDEQRCLVVDPQPIEVDGAAGSLRPTAIREAIRAFGPTV